LLASLLNEIGATLKPRVRCIINIKSQGAGIPDGGLFTPDQLSRDDSPDTMPLDTLPSRGVIEVKSTKDDVQKIAHSDQVAKYLAKYGQVLVTNYRDFLLVGRDQHGKLALLEGYHLAENEQSFWSVQLRQLVEAHADSFSDYLRRVMLSNAPLTSPQDVAWFLASYARDARRRVERAGNLPALAQVRQALEESLGITFQDEQGDHFFRSTLVQTLFYGVFSAWVLWHNEQPGRDDTFNWHDAAYYLHVPVLQSLFEQVSLPSRLKPLGLVEVLDWTGATLNRVDRPISTSRFWKPSTRSCAASSGCGTRRPKWCAIWWPVLIGCCATSLGWRMGWPTRRCIFLTPAAALVPIWLRCCARLKPRSRTRAMLRCWVKM
jgi:hypothetical protein